MKIAVVGLGRMGMGIAHRLLAHEYIVYGYDVSSDACTQFNAMGGVSLPSVVACAEQADIMWLMVPVNRVENILQEIAPYLKKDTIVIDGGNSYYEHSLKRASELAKRDVAFIDCGTSGGIHGQTRGYCLMVGGEKAVYDSIKSILQAVAVDKGLLYTGPSGTGHYVKMVHNGIEYGMLQAYAEGFQIIKEGRFKDNNLDLAAISDVWNHGSVIRSWILELSHTIFQQDQNFFEISGEVSDTGMGRWTVEEAHKHAIPAPVIESSLEVRVHSRATGGNYATKLIALLRNRFGGHAIKSDTITKRDNEDI